MSACPTILETPPLHAGIPVEVIRTLTLDRSVFKPIARLTVLLVAMRSRIIRC